MNSLFLVIGIFLISASSKKPPSAEMVRPESYAVKRFQEVIQEVKSERPVSAQEKLITERARLKVAEKRLNELETQTDPQAKYTAIRAAQARVDHHRARVERLEKEAKKSRRP